MDTYLLAAPTASSILKTKGLGCGSATPQLDIEDQKAPWEERWTWPSKRLIPHIYPLDPQRFKHYAETILTHCTPTHTLDIGGGLGMLGFHLPGKYTVMDHPRIERFCMSDFTPLGPIADVSPTPDLVVNTNSWGETNLEIVSSYLDQIADLKIPWLYLNNRRHRLVHFSEYPLDRWRQVVERPYNEHFVEFLGKLWMSGF